MDKEIFFNYLILSGIIMLFASAGFVLYELHGAKEFCKSIEGDYSLKIFKVQPLCNDKEIYHYADGWDFKKIPNTVEWNDNE